MAEPNSHQHTPSTHEDFATCEFEFTGTGREYFGIWIVNLALSIITLGIYIPWARVRTRKYLYRNTRLAGHAFDYVANPKRLLLGYILIGIFFILYSVSANIDPTLTVIVVLIFAAVFPWLRYKSWRFFAHNSTYRNIRFRFLGTLRGAYAAYLGFPILSAITLGVLWPYTAYLDKRYFHANFAYGSAKTEFLGKPGWFYVRLLVLGACIAVVFIVLALLVAGSVALFVAGSESAGSGSSEDPPAIVVVLMTAVFFAFYALMFAAAGAWFAMNRNYCWNQTRFRSSEGEIGFVSRIHIGRYIWIFLSNIFLTIVTIGLFAPFAKVRMYQYRLSRLEVTGAEYLDSAVAVAATEVAAAGDAASDLFDFEIGL